MKPCPFCKLEPIVVEIIVPGSQLHGPYMGYRVGCPDHNCRSYWDWDCLWFNRKEAIEDWEKRLAHPIVKEYSVEGI